MVASAADEAGQTVASGNRKRATVLDRVDHVIVLMLTGRSFDQLLGALRLAGRADIDGLQGDESNEWQGRRFVVHALDDPQHPPPFSPPTVFAPRPPSGRASTWQQLLGHPPYWDARAAWAHCTPGDAPQPTMGGFVQAFATGHRPGPPVSAPGTVMGYYTAASVPALTELAGAFCVCNRWFSANPGSALVNRLFAWSGRSAGLVDDAQLREVLGSPTSDPGYERLQAMTTVFDALEDHGVSWRAFHHGVSGLWLFDRFVGDARVEAVERLWATLEGDGAPLPVVTWIDPDFLAAADLRHGERVLGELYRRLRASEYWERSLLLVTHDDHGGFYDHVPPPASGEPAPFGSRGVRVPAVVASPWITTRSVSDAVFDHTSIIRSLLDRFCGGQSLDGKEPNRSDAATSLDVLPVARKARARCPTSIGASEPVATPSNEEVEALRDADASDEPLTALVELLRHRARAQAHPVEAIGEDVHRLADDLWDGFEAMSDPEPRAADRAFADAEDVLGQLRQDVGRTVDRSLQWVQRTLGVDLQTPFEALRRSWPGAHGPVVEPHDPLERLRERAGGMPSKVKRPPPDPIPSEELDRVIDHVRHRLLAHQNRDGSYPGWIFEGADPTASMAIVLDLLGELDVERSQKIANYLWSQRQSDGSFLAYGQQHDTYGRLDATATCYAALVVCGVDPLSAPMQRTFRYIQDNGDFSGCTFYTKPLLVLAGVMDAYLLPVIPMAWVLVPGVSHVLGKRLSPSFNLLVRAIGILTNELRRRVLREPVGAMASLERQVVLEYLTTHQNPTGNWYGVLSISVLTLAAIVLLGVPREDERIVRALRDMERWQTPPMPDIPAWDGKPSSPTGGIAYMAFDSRVWNTASAVSALVACGVEVDEPYIRRATMFLLEEQNELPVPRDWQNPGLWSARSGGWACEAGNAYGSDCDSSAVAMWALAHVRAQARSRDEPIQRRVDHALQRGLSWIFGMQNKNGGFPTFTHAQGTKAPGPFSIRMPDVPATLPGVISAILDPPNQVRDAPTADVNGRILQLLGMLGYTDEDPEVRRVIEFLQHNIYVNDAWWGRWIANYLAGTAEVIAGLAMVRYDLRTPWVERALEWLLRHQNDDGGWGETVDSYVSLAHAGRGASNAFLTGHIVRCLCLAGEARRPETTRGVRFLLDSVECRQTESGMQAHWDPEGYYWVMLWPWPFYRLHESSSIYGLWALALYRRAIGAATSEHDPSPRPPPPREPS